MHLVQHIIVIYFMLRSEFSQGTYDLHVQTNDIWTYPLSVTKCLTIQVTDQGTGRATFSVDHIDNTKARVFGAGGRIPRIFMIGTV